MKNFLNAIRSAEDPIPLNKKIINTVRILFIGIVLGTFSKFLDTIPTNELPFIFEFSDIRNFFGRFAFVLSVMILAVLFNMTFVYGSGYFEMRSILELVTFICAVVFLKRTTIKDTMIMLVLSCCMAFALDLIVPFHFG